MKTSADEVQLLALKLIEMFTYQPPRRYGFERYWPLAGPVPTFSEQAATPLEQEMAKALQTALETFLRETAPKSFHLEAESVVSLGAKPQKRVWKPRRRKLHQRPGPRRLRR